MSLSKVLTRFRLGQFVSLAADDFVAEVSSAFVSCTYVALNALFAFAYLACGPDALQSVAGSFANEPFYRAFFFSVDTFATIGYGNITPVGAVANSSCDVRGAPQHCRRRAGDRCDLRSFLAAFCQDHLQPQRDRCPIEG